MAFVIGVDVGGSHISSAAVDDKNFKIIDNTYFSGVVDNKASKETIFIKWADVINKTIEKLENNNSIEIAFSMPGPFDYETGRAMFAGNDKFEALYNVSVPEEFSSYLNAENVKFRFLNDASSFGIGSILVNKLHKKSRKVVAITLGTGFGASFLEDIVPLSIAENIPEDGCLWDKKFKDSIADDYFSTRWFIKKYEEYSGVKVADGVKEIASKNDQFSKKVFDEFALNFSEFLLPCLKDFGAKVLVLGGNIAKCHAQFLPKVKQIWKEQDFEIDFIVLENTEESSIVGTSYMFDNVFWDKMNFKHTSF